ncbi:MAG: dihydrolipoyl dehydrogenase [Oscillospiraceae bacterium]|nr:dihydrolipoyl dehydrogenase [Oscillospiraceae bacterium]
MYDLIIIGGGPAGYLAGERARASGLKTAVIEKRALGGVCLNEGCIPSKALLHCAKIYEYAKSGDSYGVSVAGASISHAAVVERKDRIVKRLVAGVGMKLKSKNVDVITSAAKVLPKTPEGFAVEAGGEILMAKRLLLAAGSQPVIPPIPGVHEAIENGFVLTNREILSLKEKPERLTVIGGGVVGLEMASYFNSVGSHVTVVEMLDHIGGYIDAEISALLLKIYMKKGIEFKLSAGVKNIRDIHADKVLLCVGRRASTDGLGLENIGVLCERGAVVTDGFMRTNAANVYAAGDINGRSMLAHTAYREAEVAVSHMLGRNKRSDMMRYDAIPSVIYTNPEAAGVGETEASAAVKGYSFTAARLPMAYSGRFLAENPDGEGFCKLIIDNKYNRLIGAHIIGSYASEMIYGAAMMIETEMKIDDIKEIVFPHPTVSEILRETLFER